MELFKMICTAGLYIEGSSEVPPSEGCPTLQGRGRCEHGKPHQRVTFCRDIADQPHCHCEEWEE